MPARQQIRSRKQYIRDRHHNVSNNFTHKDSLNFYNQHRTWINHPAKTPEDNQVQTVHYIDQNIDVSSFDSFDNSKGKKRNVTDVVALRILASL
jgi:hypothetical protein